MHLCTKPKDKEETAPKISQIVLKYINTRIYENMDRCYCYSDTLESELCKELDNGRLLRLLLKLGFLNERPEHTHNPNWSESGQYYIAKLLRDYVFHQDNEDGTPNVDYAHIVECLNKLDIGTDENILLQSKDERTILVVSYKEAKKILTDCFQEILNQSE